MSATNALEKNSPRRMKTQQQQALARKLPGSTYYILDAQEEKALLLKNERLSGKTVSSNEMSVYERVVDNAAQSISYVQAEKHIYGSSRLGVLNAEVPLLGNQNATYSQTTWLHTVGQRTYELQNHLGNVLSVISDKVIPHAVNETVDYYLADIRQSTDYSPFGVTLHGRNFTASGAEKFRYGFQNQEMDDEIKGEGNSVNYKYRMHDPRLGRFFAIDPLVAKYPHNSPYSFSENKVIDSRELEGLESSKSTGGSNSAGSTNTSSSSMSGGELAFFINFPGQASSIGTVNGSTNISSTASRFATRGVNDNSTDGMLNLNTSMDNIDEGSQRGAFRHVLWQAMIREKHGYYIAIKAGNAHEENPDIDLTKKVFGLGEVEKADNTVDLLNNKIGREIARLYPDISTNELAIKVTEYYYKKGFYHFEKKGDKIKVVRSKITKDQRDEMIKRFKQLDNNGETKKEASKRKKKEEEINKAAIEDAESGYYD